MSADRNARVGLIARLFGLATTIALLDRLVDWSEVYDHVVRIPMAVMAACVVLTLFRVWIMSARWRLLNPDPNNEISSWGYFRYMMISSTFNLLLPGALGGDIARSVLIYRTDSPQRFSHILSIVADRYVGLVSIILIGLLAVLFLPEIPGKLVYLTLTLCFLAAMIGGTWTLASRLLPSVAVRLLAPESSLRILLLSQHERFITVLKFYRNERRRVVAAFALCIPIHIITYATLHWFASYDGIEIAFLTLAAVSSLIWVISAIPISMAGLGTRELSFVYLLSLQGVPAEAATALSLQFFVVNVVVGILGVPLIWLSPHSTTANPLATRNSCAVSEKD